jgi:hypothetical protein
MWEVSSDYDTIDRFDFSYSTDGGQTFTGHKELARFNKNFDTQERWILGSIIGYGRDNIAVVYPNYDDVTVDGIVYHPLLQHYKYSTDGGKTFSEGKTVSSYAEIENAIRSFVAHQKTKANYAYYIQTLPWLCSDPDGGVHLAFEDNRSGQGLSKTAYFDKWHVRFASSANLAQGFGPSERVSDDVICKRPPLDFLSCAADSKRAYITWTETPGASDDWRFTGNLWVGRKSLH